MTQYNEVDLVIDLNTHKVDFNAVFNYYNNDSDKCHCTLLTTDFSEHFIITGMEQCNKRYLSALLDLGIVKPIHCGS